MMPGLALDSGEFIPAHLLPAPLFGRRSSLRSTDADARRFVALCDALLKNDHTFIAALEAAVSFPSCLDDVRAAVDQAMAATNAPARSKETT
jgi:hypothetical protein